MFRRANQFMVSFTCVASVAALLRGMKRTHRRSLEIAKIDNVTLQVERKTARIGSFHRHARPEHTSTSSEITSTVLLRARGRATCRCRKYDTEPFASTWNNTKQRAPLVTFPPWHDNAIAWRIRLVNLSKRNPGNLGGGGSGKKPRN